jgi:hypothetical protein
MKPRIPRRSNLASIIWVLDAPVLPVDKETRVTRSSQSAAAPNLLPTRLPPGLGRSNNSSSTAFPQAETHHFRVNHFAYNKHRSEVNFHYRMFQRQIDQRGAPVIGCTWWLWHKVKGPPPSSDTKRAHQRRGYEQEVVSRIYPIVYNA